MPETETLPEQAKIFSLFMCLFKKNKKKKKKIGLVSLLLLLHIKSI